MTGTSPVGATSVAISPSTQNRRSQLELALSNVEGSLPQERAQGSSPAVLFQQSEERFLVEHRDTELVRLVELRTGFRARDDEARLLRHAAGHLRAERFEPILRL